MQQLLLKLLLAFGLPWNLILWFFCIRRNSGFNVMDMFGVLVYSVYGTIINLAIIIIIGVLCLLA